MNEPSDASKLLAKFERLFPYPERFEQNSRSSNLTTMESILKDTSADDLDSLLDWLLDDEKPSYWLGKMGDWIFPVKVFAKCLERIQLDYLKATGPTAEELEDQRLEREHPDILPGSRYSVDVYAKLHAKDYTTHKMLALQEEEAERKEEERKEEERKKEERKASEPPPIPQETRDRCKKEMNTLWINLQEKYNAYVRAFAFVTRGDEIPSFFTKEEREKIEKYRRALSAQIRAQEPIEIRAVYDGWFSAFAQGEEVAALYVKEQLALTDAATRLCYRLSIAEKIFVEFPTYEQFVERTMALCAAEAAGELPPDASTAETSENPADAGKEDSGAVEARESRIALELAEIELVDFDQFDIDLVKIDQITPSPVHSGPAEMEETPADSDTEDSGPEDSSPEE